MKAMYDITLIRDQRPVSGGRFTAHVDLADGATIDPHIAAAVRRTGGDVQDVGEYEVEIREPGRSRVVMRYATARAEQ